MKNAIIILLLILAIIINVISIGLNIEERLEKNSLLETEDTDECKNLSLVDTSYCLRDELKTFFYYNMSQVGKELTEEELKIEGGVCYHYSKYYEAKLKDLNNDFYVTTKRISMDKDTNHMFTIVSNENHYCILDQLVIKCVEIGK